MFRVSLTGMQREIFCTISVGSTNIIFDKHTHTNRYSRSLVTFSFAHNIIILLLNLGEILSERQLKQLNVLIL